MYELMVRARSMKFIICQQTVHQILNVAMVLLLKWIRKIIARLPAVVCPAKHESIVKSNAN